MKLSTRIAMGYIFITLLGISLVVTTILLNNQRLHLTNQLKDVESPLDLMVQRVIGYDAMLTENVHWAILDYINNETDEVQERKETYDELGVKLDNLLKTDAPALLEKSERTPELKEKVRIALSELDRINLALVDLELRAFKALETGDTKLALSLVCEGAYYEYKDELVQLYSDWGDIENEVTLDMRNKIIIYSDRINTINLYSTIAIAILTIFLSFLIANSISKPLKKLKEEVEEVSRGKLDIQLEKSSIFEIQNLTDSLNRILATMKLAILRTGLTKGELGLGEAMKAKEEAEIKYKLLYETSLDARMTLEPPKWNFTSGNPATLKMFNVKDEKELASLTPGDLSPEKQPDGQLSSVKAKKMIEKAMKEGKAFFEWTHKRYNGESFPANVLLSRIKEGDRTYLQATVRDLTNVIGLIKKKNKSK